MALLMVIFSLLATGSFAKSSPTGSFAKSLPITEIEASPFYMQIGNVCTNSKELLKNQKEVFENCKNFTEIKISEKILPEHGEKILCSLYFNRLKSYCQSKPKQLQYPTITEIRNENYEIEKICQNIGIYSESMLSVKIPRLACLKLCSNWLDIKSECCLAHYYDLLLPVTPTQKTNISMESSVSKANPVLPIINNVSGDIEKKLVNSSQLSESTQNHNDLHKKEKSSKEENEAKQNTPLNSLGDAEVEMTDNSHVNIEPEQNKPDLRPTQADSPKVNSVSKPGDVATASDQTIEKVVETKVKVKPAKEETPEKVDKVVDDPIKEAKQEEHLDKAGLIESDNGDGEDQRPDPDGYTDVDGDTVGDDNVPQQQEVVEHKPPEKKPDTVQEMPVNSENVDEIDGESYFMSYFMVICVLVVLGYVGYHNRIKVMALLLEGKRNKRQYRGRRPNSANYHKLDSNLEEAISSNVTKSSNNVIY